jgi:Flp pilus assembly pilin Flp
VTLTLSLAVVHNPRVDRAGGERGATAVAYAVMVAILGLLLVSGFMVLSGGIDGALHEGANCVANPTDCGGGGPGGGPGGPGGPGGGSTTTRTTSVGTTTTATTATTTGP